MDDYVLLEEYGKGGFGTVHKCFDKYFSTCAIKISDETESSHKCFKNELEIYKLILKNKKHEKIIPKIYNFGFDKNKYYLAMDLYDGSLRDYIDDNRLSLRKILLIGIKGIQLIKELHKMNIIHNDIKPENFIYKEDGTIKLIDYGLAIVHNNINNIEYSDMSSRRGTLKYMSINIHNGETATMRDDLISLFYTLIYLYKQKLPWDNIKKDKEITIRILKITSNIDCPEILNELLNLVYSLGFNQKPQYNKYIEKMANYIKNNGNDMTLTF